VGIEIDTHGGLSASEREILLRGLRAALGIWLVNCKGCNVDALSVIKLDNDLWIRADFASPVIVGLDRYAGNQEKTDNSILGIRRMAFAMTAVAGDELFVKVDAGRTTALPICTNGGSTPAVARIRGALGCSPGGSDSRLEALTLAARSNAETACGSSANDIACEADPELLEFNTRDYAFCLTDLGKGCIGNGPRRLNLLHILLHEAGHWLGLDHLNNPDAIMSSTLDTSRCLNDDDVAALQAQMAGQHQRSPGPSSFRLSGAAP
jgi:hypothetical protein